MKAAEPAHGLAVLLPYRSAPIRMGVRISPLSAAILCFCAIMAASTAWAQTGSAMLSPLQVIVKWSPLLLRGFGLAATFTGFLRSSFVMGRGGS